MARVRFQRAKATSPMTASPPSPSQASLSRLAPHRAPCPRPVPRPVWHPAQPPPPQHRRRPPALAPSASAAAVGPSCGTDPVELNAYFETGFDLPFKLSEEFTKQFPNVTWKISQDQFTNLMSATPRLLSGDNPPDLIRLPSMVGLVKDGLLKNLDSYATAYGWDKWPAAQLAQNRVGSDGTRGSGSLYAMGLNYSLTGVFYNKKLATQLGMTEPPKTVAEFEDLLAKAKAAGLLPIMAWNATASGGGLAFPLQNLMAAYGPTQPINDWIFQKAGCDDRHADEPDGRPASPAMGQVRLLQQGHQRDRIHRRQRSLRQGRRRVHVQRRLAERRLRQGPRRQRRLLRLPAGESSGSLAAMSAPLTYGIADKAKNADCAAAFFNWVATNETARQIDVTVGGSNPGGPLTSAFRPRRRLGHQRDVGGWRRCRQGQWRDGLHRQCHRLHLRAGVDAGTPEARRRQARCRRPAEGRPGGVREGACPLNHAVDEARPRQGVPQPPARPLVGGSAGGSPGRWGSAGKPLSAGCSCCRPSPCTGCSFSSRSP